MNTGHERRCSFEFEGRTRYGHIVSSTRLEPHFHWFMFEDADLVAVYGDSIAFKVQSGELIPLYHLTSPNLVDAVKECVEQNIQLSITCSRVDARNGEHS
jgi:hypothetical protein